MKPAGASPAGVINDADAISMSLIKIEHNPSRRQLAVFAIAWWASLALIGGLLPRQLGALPVQALVWMLAFAVPTFGIVVPGFLRGVYLASVYAAWPIGVVMSYLMLGLIYYLVVTPTGLVMGLFGHDPLSRRFDRQRESYWVPRKEAQDADRYFQQF